MKNQKSLFVVRVLLFFLVCVHLTLNSFAECASPPTLAGKIAEKVGKFAAAYQFNGNILVAKGNQLLFTKSYGPANLERRVANATQTRFLIGAITQQFTAVLILKLQEQNLLSVDDTINNYIPDFPGCDQITIHQLLNHTSGLPNTIQWTKIPANLSEAIEIAKAAPIKFAFSPGQGYGYSDIGYILLGYIIERVSGEPYRENLQNKIFTPLKMANSGVGYDYAKDQNLAFSYGSDNLPSLKNPIFFTLMRTGAAVGVYSTTEDLFKWSRALSATNLLTQNSLSKMFTANKSSYGYGWYISSENGKNKFSNTGSILGFRSAMIRRVDEDICIIALSNRDNFGEFETNMLDTGISKCLNP